MNMVLPLLIFLSLARQAQADGIRPFAVIGDTQRTLVVERLFLWREQNDEARPELISSIVADQPSFLVHLGDMVDWGGSQRAWKYFDSITEPLKTAHIDIFPVIGNHEYFGLSEKREMGFVEDRFPQIKLSHWYVKKYGALALVLLDSNRASLGEDAWQTELRWYRDTLKQLDLDPEVRGVLVFAHHPALSNSKISGDEKCVREGFLPPLLEAKKTLAYIDGHAHGYEHFKENGKHFIVSGGGGGPRVTYWTGAKARHSDLYQGPVPRPFNYLLIQQLDDQVLVIVKGFQKNETEIKVIDRIAIPFGG
jgi:hypothetical protein